MRRDIIIQNIKKVAIIFSFLTIACIVYSIIYNSRAHEDNMTKSLQSNLIKKIEISNKLINKIEELKKSSQVRNYLANDPNDITIIAEKENITLFIEAFSKLQYWTEHTQDIPFETNTFISTTPKFINFKNSCYVYVSRKIENNINISAFILIKDLYPLNNEFFPPKFPNNFNVSNSSSVFNLDEKTNDNASLITDDKGNPLFYFSPDIAPALELSTTHLILYFVTYYAFLLLLMLILLWVEAKYGSFIYSISLLVFVLLGVLLYILPNNYLLFSNLIFSPRLFAIQSWLPSLGHLIIYLSNFMFLLFSILLVIREKNKRNERCSKVIITVFYFSNAIFFVALMYLLNLMCNNSSLAIDFRYISFSDYKLYLYYFAISLASFSFCIISFLISVLSSNIQFLTKLLLRSVIVLLAFLISYFYFEFAWWTFLFHFVLLYLPDYTIKSSSKFPDKVNPRFILIILFIVSAFCNLMISHFNQPIVQSYIQTKISNLDIMTTSKNNTWIEFLLEDISKKIEKDITSKNLNKKTLEQIINNYFHYIDWEKYEIITAFIDENEALEPSESYKIFNSKFYKYNNNEDQLKYAGYFHLKIDNNDLVCLVKIIPKSIEENYGYSKLLNNSLIEASIGKQLSYASYVNGKLTLSSGIFSYNNSDIWLLSNENNNYFKKDNYEHWILSNSQNKKVVISFPSINTGSFLLINTFSTIYFTLILILVILTGISLNFIKVHKTFAFRLSSSFTLIFFIFIFIVGTFTLNINIKQYKDNEMKLLTQKANQVFNTLYREISTDNNFKDSIFLANEIRNISSEFGVEINIFNADGYLTHSSKPDIFQRGLRSQLMSLSAKIQISTKRTPELIRKEEIGTLTFFSYYSGIYSTSGDLIGYFNIPFFYSFNKLNLSIYNLLAGIINIYLFLLIVASFFIIVISKKLTRPLTELQENIQKFKIGDSNNKMNYENKDEIGELIDEYNNMLVTIRNQAEKLAETERETAWRTMAKQIAHEIKNPLTPIKLKLQQLQSLKRSKSQKFDQYFESAAPVIVDQINSLAEIADEFSNFAKISDETIGDEVEIIEFINQFKILYSSNKDIEIIVNNHQWKELWIMIDRNKLSQVFNNIICNAIQANNNNKCTITLNVDFHNGKLIISFTNYGDMIPEDIQDKIFNPNFTTKSSGTGLGLPLSKRIINSFNGDLWFVTSHRETTFFILLDCVRNKDSNK